MVLRVFSLFGVFALNLSSGLWAFVLPKRFRLVVFGWFALFAFVLVFGVYVYVLEDVLVNVGFYCMVTGCLCYVWAVGAFVDGCIC